jgi:hypothetical protein
MGFNILPIGGRTHIVFGWLDKKPQNRKFIETFDELPESVLASAIIQFCFDTSDNVFVRPSWWEKLPNVPKEYLILNLRSSIPGDKQPDGLVPRLPPLIQLPVLERRTELVSTASSPRG